MAMTDPNGAQIAEQASAYLALAGLYDAGQEFSDAWAELVDSPLGLALEGVYTTPRVERPSQAEVAEAARRVRGAMQGAAAALDDALALATAHEEVWR